MDWRAIKNAMLTIKNQVILVRYTVGKFIIKKI